MPAWLEYLAAAKTTLDILKGVRAELPAGPQADHVGQHIEKAEAALKTTEAELAKNLGYKLCRCNFSPKIMLWNGAEQTNICPACGDRNPPPVQVRRTPDYEPDWITVRR